MPNWCDNRLRIFGPPDEIEKFQRQATGHAPWLSEHERQTTAPSPLNFHRLLPVPAEVLAQHNGDVLEKWQVANWGTKWEADETELVDEWDTGVCYGFNTAWSPPIALLKSIGPNWPTLKFLLHYEELGCAFVGVCKVEDATCEDHCLNI